ncbi:MAG: formate dehydrogenase accessory sulfurtransferase FdhD [Planctomycetota bacterium]
MSLTWVICGAGRRVGKTTLARKLSAALPNAVYAKQGCGTRQPGKPANYFQTDQELAAFVSAAQARHEHVVVESNELARQGAGDIIIFLDSATDRGDIRSDADLLRTQAHLRISDSVQPENWREILQHKLTSTTLCAAVGELLTQHADWRCVPDSLVQPVTPLRVTTDGDQPRPDPSAVVVEELITVMIKDVGNFALLCTPCDVEELAIGFTFSEGLITSIDDIVAQVYQPEQRCVALQLEAPPDTPTSRNLIVTSSCGLCGQGNIEALLAGDMHCGDGFRVDLTTIHAAIAEMQARQRLFAQTGGTHAAGIFNAAGEMLAFGEDIGRHNAFDKAVGHCLRRGISTAGSAAVLSGRASVELVAKAARAGVELIAAVSAPSSLAMCVAQRCNITLCGFVRAQRATVYTHPHRIITSRQ